jgi:hypothetical protein
MLHILASYYQPPVGALAVKGRSVEDSYIALQNKRVDTAVAATKGVLGAVPFAGGALAEIIGSVVPNQRLERITDFLIELDKRLKKFEIEKLNDNKFALDLFEDGMYQAVRALSNERNKYLANFLKQTIDVDAESYSTKKKLLSILQELTDKDIAILVSISKRWYQATAREYGVSGLTNGAFNILSDTEQSEYKHQQVGFGLHIATLNRLNLVYIKEKEIDPEWGNSHVDHNTGLPEVDDCNLTRIGELLLSNIGATDC